ncbi:MAG: glyoxalase [Acidobacteria bacterium]|jgi:catechol 2,3-dioxygenase-like lactoylglutathione lyase family enzyme|nr:MAG: glyoxalase [Acidobacteriota bacterium]PYV30664.1 MAG: glyoxalase [Acidobacteriota bacterium]
MLGVRHIALRVRDIERSLDFYTRVMKMTVEWRPDAKNVYLTSGNDNLALHEIDTPYQAPTAALTPGLDHFGFIVSQPEEVDEWARDLESQGIKLVQQPKTHRDGARSIYFHDPDGNLIQLLYHPPIS